MMQMATSLDWISVTAKQLYHPKEILPSGVKVGKVKRPLKWFDAGNEVVPSGSLYHNHEDKLTMLQLTGNDLSSWRATGKQDQWVLEQISNFRVTRLDFAIDVFHGDFDIDKLSQEWKDGNCKGTIRSGYSYQELVGTGYTLYLGGKKSEQRIRIYNKAAEQKITSMSWVRIELQARGDKADYLASDMRRYGIKRAGRMRIRELANFQGVMWYDLATSDEYVKLAKVPEKETSTIRWLREQVLPCIQKVEGSDIERAYEVTSEMLRSLEKKMGVIHSLDS